MSLNTVSVVGWSMMEGHVMSTCSLNVISNFNLWFSQSFPNFTFSRAKVSLWNVSFSLPAILLSVFAILLCLSDCVPLSILQEVERASTWTEAPSSLLFSCFFKIFVSANYLFLPSKLNRNAVQAVLWRYRMSSQLLFDYEANVPLNRQLEIVSPNTILKQDTISPNLGECPYSEMHV